MVLAASNLTWISVHILRFSCTMPHHHPFDVVCFSVPLHFFSNYYQLSFLGVSCVKLYSRIIACQTWNSSIRNDSDAIQGFMFSCWRIPNFISCKGAVRTHLGMKTMPMLPETLTWLVSKSASCKRIVVSIWDSRSSMRRSPSLSSKDSFWTTLLKELMSSCWYHLIHSGLC